jgi:hypothetical protein
MNINKLKKLLSIIFLMPIIPMVGIGAEETKSEDEVDKVTDEEATKTTDDDKVDEAKVENKIYTQKEIDLIISKVTKKHKLNTEKEVKAAIEKLNMTEADRLKLEKEELQKIADSKVEVANKKLIKFEVKQMSEKLGFIDSDIAMLLLNNENIEIDDDGNITGVEEELKRIMQLKPHLVKKVKADTDDTKTKVGDDQNNVNNKKSPFSMTDLIRRAAGR